MRSTAAARRRCWSTSCSPTSASRQAGSAGRLVGRRPSTTSCVPSTGSDRWSSPDWRRWCSRPRPPATTIAGAIVVRCSRRPGGDAGCCRRGRTSADRSCSAAASCRTSRQWPGGWSRSFRRDPRRVAGHHRVRRRRRRGRARPAQRRRATSTTPSSLGCGLRSSPCARPCGSRTRRASGRSGNTALHSRSTLRSPSRRSATSSPPARIACGAFGVAGGVSRPGLEQPQPAAASPGIGTCVEQRQRVAGPVGVEQPARSPRRRGATRPAPVRAAATACSAASPRRPSAPAASASPRSAHAFSAWPQRGLVAGRWPGDGRRGRGRGRRGGSRSANWAGARRVVAPSRRPTT